MLLSHEERPLAAFDTAAAVDVSLILIRDADLNDFVDLEAVQPVPGKAKL